MASYIDNIFINARTQDVQAYTPDWNFLNQGQQILSATQKRNFADFAQRYNSIIDGDLTRQDNIKLRDTYKVQANEFVKQVSGADLTDPRNVKAAGAVFTPLVDNKMYIRDIVNTRAVKDAYAKTQSYATSLNPAERDLYNENSLKQLNYFLQDFKNASPGEALGMKAPAYTPGINLEKMALNFFNRQQYDVEVEQNTGQWLIKTKGGKLVEGNLATGLMAEFYGDPLVRQNIVLENQMQKRDFVESNLMNYNGNKTAAEAAFYEQKYSGRLNFLETEGKKVIDDINGEVEVVDAVMKQLAKGENSDNTPMSDETLTARELLMQNAERLKKLQQGIKQETAQAIAASTTKSKASAPYTINIEGKSYTPEQLDAIAFQSKVGAIANRLAMSRFSQTVKDNPYAMEQFKSDLSWRNKERELKLEAQLDAEAVMSTSLPNMVDISMGSDEIFEKVKDNPSKLLNLDQERITSSAVETASFEKQVIKTYYQMFPAEAKKSIDVMTPAERAAVVSKAQGLIKAGSLSKDNHALLSSNLFKYSTNLQVTQELDTRVKDNLRVAINMAATKGDILPENKELLLNLLETTTDLNRLKELFIEKRSGAISVNRATRNLSSPAFINPVGALVNSFRDLVANSPETQATIEFDELFGDGEAMISKAYYDRANSIGAAAMGYTAGVGGITNFGKDLGQASNTKNTAADLVLNYAYQSVLTNNLKSYYPGNLRDDPNKKPMVAGTQLIQNLLQTYVEQVNQQQKETTGTLRTVNVQVSVDPVTNDQIIYVRPNEAMSELTYGGSDNKVGITTKEKADQILQEGFTFKIPAGSIPSNVLGIEKLSPSQQLFALKGELTLGGDMSADKGMIRISKNSAGRFDVIGSRYENGKVIPLGSELESIVNNSYVRALSEKQAGQSIDPEAFVIRQLEEYLNQL